jgi:hypothetical protein
LGVFFGSPAGILHGSRPILCNVIVPSVPPNESDAGGPAAGDFLCRSFVGLLLKFSNETLLAAKGFPNGEVLFSGNGGGHIDVSVKDI